MKRCLLTALLGLAAVIAVVIVACSGGSGGGGGGGGGGGSGGTSQMVSVKLNFSLPGAPVQSLQAQATKIVPMSPIGLASGVQSIKVVSVSDGTSTWVSNQVVTTPFSTTASVPSGSTLTVTAEGWTDTTGGGSGGTKTFQTGGTTEAPVTGLSSTGPDSIGLQAIDNGSPIGPPTVAFGSPVITCPAADTGCTAGVLLVGGTLTATVTVGGGTAGNLSLNAVGGGTTGGTWSLGTISDGAAVPSCTAGSCTVTSLSANDTVPFIWTPTASGASSGVSVTVTDSETPTGTTVTQTTAVQTDVTIATGATSNPGVAFAFGPVITGLSGLNLGVPNGATLATLELTVTTGVSLGISGSIGVTLTQPNPTPTVTSSGTSSTLVVDIIGTSTTGFDVTKTGLLAVTATDSTTPTPLSTTNTYSLVAGQFPAPLSY